MSIIYEYPPRGSSVATYANLAAFPVTAGQGTLAIALDTGFLYEFIGAAWIPIAGPGSILSIGTFDSGTASAEGAHIDLNQLIMQSASATVPGLVNLSAQTFLGIKTFQSGIDLASQNINNLLDPTTAQQAATKQYVDNLASGIQPVQACYAASTANIVGTYNNGASGVGATLTVTATGAFILDGISLALNERVLLKDQTLSEQNGIYVVTDPGSPGIQPVFTRATDFDTPAKINNGDLVPVLLGLVNEKTSWLQISTVITVGTSPITFMVWSYNPNNFIQTIGPIDSQTKSANGAVKATTTLVLQNADTSFPGLVSIGAQSFAGNKTFTGTVATNAITSATTIAATGNITGANLSGTNTGDITVANQLITLNSTDITNQYVDLAQTVKNVSSVTLNVQGGPDQYNTIDFTISQTGGVSGVTRITFIGDLATAGFAALVDGDIILVGYAY